jgi:hypothetical protein
MNYTELKDKLQAELADLLERRAELNTQVDAASTFEYAKLCGQIIGTYKAIIMVQETEIEEPSNKEV